MKLLGEAKHYAQDAAALILLTVAAVFMTLADAATGRHTEGDDLNDYSWVI